MAANNIHPWLSSDEVRDLTQRVRRTAQLRQLASLGMTSSIKFRTDGSFIVMRGAEAPGSSKIDYTLDFAGLGRGT